MIKCQGCKEVLKDNDYVILDMLNGLTHFACYNRHYYQSVEGIKNVGTYLTMKETYWFFDELARRTDF